MSDEQENNRLVAEGAAIARACAVGFSFEGRPDPDEPTILMGMREHDDCVDILVLGLTPDAVAMGGRYPNTDGSAFDDGGPPPIHSIRGSILEVIDTVLNWQNP